MLADPLVDKETGEIVIPADTYVTEDMIDAIDEKQEHAIFGDDKEPCAVYLKSRTAAA